MTVYSYSQVRTKKDALIRKSLDGGVHMAPMSATAPTLATAFDATTGGLKVLPTGFYDLGYLTADGVKVSRSITSTKINSWQSLASTRVDITADDETIKFVCQQTSIHTIAMFYNALESSIATTPHINGAIEIDKPKTPLQVYYRCIVIGVDGSGATEIDIVRFFPRVTVASLTDQGFSNGSDALDYGFELETTMTDVLGFSAATYFGGQGWLAGLAAAGFTAGSTLEGPPEGDIDPESIGGDNAEALAALANATGRTHAKAAK